MFFKKKSQDKIENRLENLLTEYSASSRYAEAYRTLRANLFFASPEKEVGSVIVTSSVESEGKTNTVVNLAYTMVQADKKVLMIDADLRRPKLSELFSMQSIKGLSDIIANDLDVCPAEGNFDQFSLKDIMHLARFNKSSGRLVVSENSEKVSILFNHGIPIDINWKTRPKNKKFLSVLIKKGLLSKEDAYSALAERKQSAKNMAAVLKTMGVVSKENLLKELSIQIIESIGALNKISKGSFNFSSGSVVKDGRVAEFKEIDINELLMEYLEPAVFVSCFKRFFLLSRLEYI